ncbi:MAG: nickel pincer cofactor biosynthesis protein LarC [Planctomycetota bacterium]
MRTAIHGEGARTLWLDPFGGMAGDMFLAALLDLGHPAFTLEDLRGLCEELLPGEVHLHAGRVSRQGLMGLHLDVRTPESGTIPHRGLAELLHRVDHCTRLDGVARLRVQRALEALADAEARVHGCTREEVHFHEVGAVDTLVDVVGAAWALQRLEVGQIVCSAPLLGSGTVRCAHGELPVPAPATLELLRGLPVRNGGGGGERVTPTGAALLSAWGTWQMPRGQTQPVNVGYGAGTRDPGPEVGPANLLRVTLVEAAPKAGGGDEVWQMQVNLDDITAQDLAFASERIWEAGVLDLWTQGIQMKKQRAGVLLSALVPASRRRAVEAALFAHTTTFGVRWWATERTECERHMQTLTIEGHSVRIKLRRVPGEEDWTSFVEYEDLVPLAGHWQLPLWQARERVLAWHAGQ